MKNIQIRCDKNGDSFTGNHEHHHKHYQLTLIQSFQTGHFHWKQRPHTSSDGPSLNRVNSSIGTRFSGNSVNVNEM